MINLIKLPKPQILIDNELNWTNILMGHVSSGTKIPSSVQGHYRHPEIKNCVKLETAEKCIYCESKISHVYAGDVEHIIPKSLFPELTFDWDNLSFICYWCNNHKRDYYDPTHKLLNPYVDNITDHLILMGPFVHHVNHSKRGEITHKVIKLNRPELRERRLEAIQGFGTLIDKYHQETVPVLKEILKQEIIDEIASTQEFSKFKYQFLINLKVIL